MLAANCFVLRNDREAVVIDPGGNPEVILPLINERELLYIVNTHGHYDHIAANNDLKARFSTQLAVSKYDSNMLLNPDLNLSTMVDARYISVAPDILLDDGDKLAIGGESLEIIYTPGHTKGSVSIKMGQVLFSGDTLFYRSIGRTDLPTGSFDELENSIRTRLYVLPDDTKVYTGHGEATIIGEEKRYNEWVRIDD
ncbi:MAG: MBL fold metallo-hydrolase [Spirochaetota bacterium]|nr:MAG: MBL fold metallo-hydrolase [Spirochaetota bacterium]